MNTLTRSLGMAIAATALVIAACGGGGDDPPPVAGGAGTGGNTAGNPFAAMVGNWSSGCVNTGVFADGPHSEIVTATLGNLSGADKATVSISDKTYYGSATCEEAKLAQSGEAGGEVTALAPTKAIKGDPDHLKTGTAATANFRLDRVTFHKVSLNFVPVTGAISKVGYMLQDGKLYGVSGSREADGLGRRFANLPLTKQ